MIDTVRKALQVADIALGLALSAWIFWRIAGSDPSSFPAQAQRRARARYDQYRARRRQRAEDALERADFGLAVGLFIEREVNKWARSHTCTPAP